MQPACLSGVSSNSNRISCFANARIDLLVGECDRHELKGKLVPQGEM
jgi:hypothetical protein